MQQRPTNGTFERPGSLSFSVFWSFSRLLLAVAVWVSVFPLSSTTRYTSAPRTVQLLWQRNGLPAFYRGFLLCISLHIRASTDFRSDLEWFRPVKLVQESYRRWCEQFHKLWPFSRFTSTLWPPSIWERIPSHGAWTLRPRRQGQGLLGDFHFLASADLLNDSVDSVDSVVLALKKQVVMLW